MNDIVSIYLWFFFVIIIWKVKISLLFLNLKISLSFFQDLKMWQYFNGPTDIQPNLIQLKLDWINKIKRELLLVPLQFLLAPTKLLPPFFIPRMPLLWNHNSIVYFLVPDIITESWFCYFFLHFLITTESQIHYYFCPHHNKNHDFVVIKNLNNIIEIPFIIFFKNWIKKKKNILCFLLIEHYFSWDILIEHCFSWGVLTKHYFFLIHNQLY